MEEKRTNWLLIVLLIVCVMIIGVLIGYILWHNSPTDTTNTQDKSNEAEKTDTQVKETTTNNNEPSVNYQWHALDVTCKDIDTTINGINIKVNSNDDEMCSTTLIINGNKLYDSINDMISVYDIFVSDKLVLLGVDDKLETYNTETKQKSNLDILMCSYFNDYEIKDSSLFIKVDYTLQCEYPVKGFNKFDTSTCDNYKTKVNQYVSERKYEIKHLDNGNVSSQIIEEKMLVNDTEKYNEYIETRNC